MKKKYNRKCALLILPSLAGIGVFYLIPYIRVIFYSLIENQFSKKFVGLKNYGTLLKNSYFRLAMKNSLLLILIGVPILVLTALIISILILNLNKRWRKLRISFILPMLIPTSSIVLIWRIIFSEIDSPLPIYLLFIWKNVGLLVILFSAAFTMLDPLIFEAAKLDGASGIKLHSKITLPLIAPTIYFTTLLGIVFTFKIFRESFLYYGSNYPPNHSYTLQYYMNNHFFKLNYQNLATGAILTSLIIYIIVLLGIRIQKKWQWQ